MNREGHSNLTSDLLNDISWEYIINNCKEKGLESTQIYCQSKLYKDIEEDIICCFFNNPELLENTILKDKHFINIHMKSLFIFFKKFYSIYKNLDMPIMMNRTRDKDKLYILLKLITDYNFGFERDFKNLEIELIEKYRLTLIKEEFIKTIYAEQSIQEFKERISDI